jgi:hypothetical protein
MEQDGGHELEENEVDISVAEIDGFDEDPLCCGNVSSWEETDFFYRMSRDMQDGHTDHDHTYSTDSATATTTATTAAAATSAGR